MKIQKILTFLLISALSYCLCYGEELPSDINNFVQKKIHGINLKNLEELKQTVHPRCLDKIKMDLTKELNYQIPADYTVKLTPLSKDDNQLMQAVLSLPLDIKPTYLVQLSFNNTNKAESHATVLSWEIIKNDNQWLEVAPGLSMSLQASLKIVTSEDKIPEDKKEEFSPEINAFIQKRVHAINTKNFDELKQTIHPKSLEKITALNKDFYDDLFAKDINYQIPENYNLRVTEISKDQPLPFESMFTFTVRPTHWFQLDYQIDSSSGIILLWAVVKEDARWYEVVPEPTQETLNRTREKKIKEQEEIKLAKEIASNLDSDLKTHLQQLLQDGHTIDAINLLRDKKRISLSLAKRIVYGMKSK